MEAAAGGGSLRGLYEEAVCPICLDYFQEPVILIQCSHNFCRACLTRYWEGFGANKAPSCPECREKGPRKFIANRQLAHLALKLRLLEEEKATERKRLCQKHQEPLKLFCKEEETLLCVVCDRSREHRGHQVVPLEEAAQVYQELITNLLDLLKRERAEITKYKEETEKESQDLLKQTEIEMANMKAEFRKLHQFLEEQEKLLLAQVEEMKKEIARKREEHLARLSEELSSLEGLIQEMEKKQQQPPRELLQDVRSILQSQEKEPFQNPVPFPPELKWKIWEICERNASLTGTEKQSRANVTLDLDTANPFLILSEDRKSVRYGDQDQGLPANPERFALHPFVLGREGFTTGRHYWDVNVDTEEQWAVGVARKSVRRKDYIELSTEEGIWAMGKWDIDYYVHGHALSLSGKLKRIRVSLNVEGHRVAFYDAETGSHLYTFYGASFSGETLCPFFYVWGKAQISISP